MYTTEKAKKVIDNIIRIVNTEGYYSIQYIDDNFTGVYVERKMNENYSFKGITFVIQMNNMIFFPDCLEEKYFNWIEHKDDKPCLDECTGLLFENDRDKEIFIKALQSLY